MTTRVLIVAEAEGLSKTVTVFGEGLFCLDPDRLNYGIGLYCMKVP